MFPDLSYLQQYYFVRTIFRLGNFINLFVAYLQTLFN